MAATIDKEVSAIIREHADSDDLNDYVLCVLDSGERWDAEHLLSNEQLEAIADRGNHARVTLHISRDDAYYIQRRCDGLGTRGSRKESRFKEMRNPGAYRASGVVCEGWFVSPDASIVQGSWKMVHWFGRDAVLECTLYHSNSSLYGKKAAA